jgi:calcineurin-like phosphoesterase family protein
VIIFNEFVKDWYDGYIEEAEDMNVYLISDTHFNHDAEGGVMRTYCMRPEKYADLIVKHWRETVKPEDLVIHLGDVMIGKRDDRLRFLPGRKILVRGNHDRAQSNTWWMEKGAFDFACDGFMFRNVWLTHEPANALPEGALYNVHGHLHNIWDGFHKPERLERDKEVLGIDPTKQLKHPWQRLFATEYTDYRPVEFNKFISHPEKYQATGPRKRGD